ncbi:hypothetical protein RHGRI_003548 [Rhododendron griersonianum]|uniref:Uncharacterized protein n=1 Tax=Rhododendron griersonianum TaxID=479676 RepID=A0AAV6L6P5_9ERIC|nr:hypothetical protein RHGRI_003548 [Rhododendron griersonianum]
METSPIGAQGDGLNACGLGGPWMAVGLYWLRVGWVVCLGGRLGIYGRYGCEEWIVRVSSWFELGRGRAGGCGV